MTAYSPPISTKVDIETQDLLSQAAAIAGMSSINSFVLSAAVEKAKKIMERERSLKLSQRDAMMLIDALDSPAKSDLISLQEASKRYKSKNQS